METLEPRVLLSASVFTDQLDYAPGETAFITGSGFEAGESVELQGLHIEGGADGECGTEDDTLGDNTGAGHDPWYVVDGGAGDLDGVADGNFETSWLVDPDDSLDETFQLTATGQTSRAVATTSFTDALDDNPTDNRIGRHQVWEITTTQYVPGLVTGYREGDSASFVVEVTVSDADVAAAGGSLTLDFGIQLDLVADSGADGFAFVDLGDFDDTVTPPIANIAGGNTVVDSSVSDHSKPATYDHFKTSHIEQVNSNR